MDAETAGTPILPDLLGPVTLSITGTLYGPRDPMFLRQEIGSGNIPGTDLTFTVDQTVPSAGVMIVHLDRNGEAVRSVTITLHAVVAAALDVLRDEGQPHHPLSVTEADDDADTPTTDDDEPASSG